MTAIGIDPVLELGLRFLVVLKGFSCSFRLSEM